MTQLLVIGCIFTIYAVIGSAVFLILKYLGVFNWLKNTMIGDYLSDVWGL